jgi:hypothetical protein
MQTTGAGAFVVHGATPCCGIEVAAIAIGAAGQRKDVIFEIEAFNQARFLQTLGNLFRFFVFGFKGVHQFKPYQVGQLHLHWHGAAVGGAAVAQTVFVAGPGVAVVDVDNRDV